MKLKPLVLTAALVATLSGCTVVSPPNEEVAVLTDRPWLFGDGGIRTDDVRKGGTRTYTWWTTQKQYIKVSPTAVSVTFDDFSSVDNILLDFNTTIRYRTTNAPALVQLGPEWFRDNIQSQYTDIVRSQVKRYTMQQMMSDGHTAEKLDADITAAIGRVASEQKLPIEILGINLGRAKPNPNVLAQMNNTAAEQQRKLTMIQSTLAEQERAKQQKAKAQADNAYRNEVGLSPEQYLSLRMGELTVAACSQAKECVLIPPSTNVVR